MREYLSHLDKSTSEQVRAADSAAVEWRQEAREHAFKMQDMYLRMLAAETEVGGMQESRDKAKTDLFMMQEENLKLKEDLASLRYSTVVEYLDFSDRGENEKHAPKHRPLPTRRKPKWNAAKGP